MSYVKYIFNNYLTIYSNICTVISFVLLIIHFPFFTSIMSIHTMLNSSLLSIPVPLYGYMYTYSPSMVKISYTCSFPVSSVLWYRMTSTSSPPLLITHLHIPQVRTKHTFMMIQYMNKNAMTQVTNLFVELIN